MVLERVWASLWDGTVDWDGVERLVAWDEEHWGYYFAYPLYKNHTC